jgi:hypothetical protein
MKSPAISRLSIIPAIAAFAITAPAQTTLYTYLGDTPYDELGRSVSDVGDVNADGCPDFVIGEPAGANPLGLRPGLARVHSGKDGSLIHVVYGIRHGGTFGKSVSGAGDVDADGVPDFVVGAPHGHPSGTNAGLAFVYSGDTGLLLLTLAGAPVHDEFGFSVSGAGDVNADGHSDVIVGSMFDESNGRTSGVARVFSGADGSVLYLLDSHSTAGDRFGFSVSDAGDMNGDGYADFMVGAPSDEGALANSGSVRVFSGRTGSVLTTLYGEVGFASFGSALSRSGDVNGDGVEDIIVGAPGSVPNTFEGDAYVYSGRNWSVIHQYSGGPDYAKAVSGAGDVDGDGFDDFIVSDQFYRDENNYPIGKVTVYSGRRGIALSTIYGVTPYEEFGTAVSGLGDADGDGLMEIIIGTPWTFTTSYRGGSAIVVSLGVTPENPAVPLVEELLQIVVDLNLGSGIENGLDAKLEAVRRALDDLNEHNDVAAVNALEAFIASVQAQSGGKISEVDADSLTASAQAIIDLLNGT